MNQKKRGFKFKKLWVSYAFLAPYAVIFILFTILPVGMAIFNSFTRYNVLQPPVFVWLDNYIQMFTTDKIFLKSLTNTLFLAMVIGPGGYGLSLLLAWMINNLPRALRTFFVVVFYAPTASSAIYVIWAIIFSPDEYGLINGFLKSWGFIQEPVAWLFDTRYMMGVLIVCQLWVSMGLGFLSFVAGLKNIDQQYYEAGAIDGIQNRWQELWFITLPMLMPQLMFGAIMSITASFGIHEVTQAIFGLPSTAYAVHTMSNHMWDYFYIRYEVGYASAIATLLFLMMVGSNKLVNALLRRIGK